ncbi:MAG: hypothetical protein JF628_05180 [Sphingomonas sp.]|nr:hypothetical protein [Sphingomonas sp.]
MANRPDAHPDSDSSNPDDSRERATPDQDKTRKHVQDAPGDFAGTAGTGGENKVQDQGFER